MFWELMDERGGEAECAFFVYCSRVFLAFAHTEMAKAGWRPAPHTSGDAPPSFAGEDAGVVDLEDEDELDDDELAAMEAERLNPLAVLAGNWPKDELKRVPPSLLLPAATVNAAVQQIMRRATPEAREALGAALATKIVARPQRVDGKTIDTPWIDVNSALRLLVKEYRKEHAHSLSTMRVMFETASVEEEVDDGKGGAGDDAASAIPAHKQTIDVHQLIALLRTIDQDIDRGRCVDIYIDAHRAASIAIGTNSAGVTLDALLAVCERHGIFGDGLRLPPFARALLSEAITPEQRSELSSMITHRWKRFKPVVGQVVAQYDASPYARVELALRRDELELQLKEAQASGDGRLALCIYRRLLVQALNVQVHAKEDSGPAAHAHAVNHERRDLNRLEVLLGHELQSAPESHFARAYCAAKIQLAWRRKFRSFLVPLPLRRCCSRALRDKIPVASAFDAAMEAHADAPSLQQQAAAAESAPEAEAGAESDAGVAEAKEAAAAAGEGDAAAPGAAEAAAAAEEEEEGPDCRSLPWLLATIRVVYEDLLLHMTGSDKGTTFHRAPQATLPQMLYRVLLQRTGLRRRADNMVRELCKAWRVYAPTEPRVALFAAFFGDGHLTETDFGPEIQDGAAIAFYFQALAQLLVVKVLPPVEPKDPDAEEDTDDEEEEEGKAPAALEPIRLLFPTGKPYPGPEAGSEGSTKVSSNQAQRLARAMFVGTDDAALKLLSVALKPDGAKKIDVDAALLLMLKRWNEVMVRREAQLRSALRSGVAALNAPGGGGAAAYGATHALSSPEHFAETLSRNKSAAAGDAKLALHAYLDLVSVVERRRLAPGVALFPGGATGAAALDVESEYTAALCVQLCRRRGLLQWAAMGDVRLPADFFPDPQNRFNLLYMQVQPYRRALPVLLQEYGDAEESKARHLSAAFKKVCDAVDELAEAPVLYPSVVEAAHCSARTFFSQLHSVEVLDQALVPEVAPSGDAARSGSGTQSAPASPKPDAAA